MTMWDLIDHFIVFLMREFNKSLEKDLKRWTDNLREAIGEDNQDNIDTSIEYIQTYRELMTDLRDENMTGKDFVGLIAEKYGFDRAEVKEK